MKLALAILALLLAGCGRPEVFVPPSMQPVYVRVGYLHPERLPNTLRIHDAKMRLFLYSLEMEPLMDVVIVPRPTYMALEKRAKVRLLDSRHYPVKP